MRNLLLQEEANKVLAETIPIIDPNTISIWFWIAIVEFITIAFLILKLRKRNESLKFGDLSKDKIKNAKKGDVDMNNLMNSINGSKVLYKELSRSCHPDRFINSDKQKISQEIFQEITKNRRNFKKLEELKEKAKLELNLKFK